MTTQQLPVDKIKLDPKLQPRNELNADAIQQYADDMRNGDQFPPVEIKKVNGKYLLTSGWHRTLAAQRAKLTTISAIITEGTWDDAVWEACAANVEHDKSGSRRTNADKQKAVKMALQLERFHNGMMNYTKIADHIGVDRTMVSRWYNKLYGSELNHNTGNARIASKFTNDPSPGCAERLSITGPRSNATARPWPQPRRRCRRIGNGCLSC